MFTFFGFHTCFLFDSLSQFSSFKATCLVVMLPVWSWLNRIISSVTDGNLGSEQFEYSAKSESCLLQYLLGRWFERMRNIWYFVAAQWHFHPWCRCVTHCVTGCICYSVQMGVNGGIVNFLMENVKLRLIFFCWQNDNEWRKLFLMYRLPEHYTSLNLQLHLFISDQHPYAIKRSQFS